MALSVFRQEAPPPPPPPIVINKYSDEQLRAIITRMRDRLELYKEKAIDQYASSPEISPPVSESKHRIIHLQLPSVYVMCNLLIMTTVGALTGNSVALSAPLLRKDMYTKVIEERNRQAEEDRIKKEEADKKKKEEQEKKKKEAEEKKKEEEEKRLAEEKKEKKSITSRLRETSWYLVDVVLKPIEDQMDPVLGNTIDPFTDRRYIAWLSLVTLAFNYNTWFITARLCFPYHTESAIPFWFALDMVADLIYLIDSIIFQPRKQFVKAGDIIVSAGLASFSAE